MIFPSHPFAGMESPDGVPGADPRRPRPGVGVV